MRPSDTQVDALKSISALVLLEALNVPSFVLGAQALDEVLVRRVRVARETDPEALGNSLLPPTELDDGRSIKSNAPVRPPLVRTESGRTDSGETVAPPSIPNILYPGIAGAEADVGMRHSIRDLATPIWVNASWRSTFRHDGDGSFSFFELLSADDGVKFCEFVREVLMTSRKAPYERRPVTVALSLSPSAWKALPEAERTAVPVKLVGNLVHTADESMVNQNSFIICTFAAELALPSFEVMPPLELGDLDDDDTTPLNESALPAGPPSRSQFTIHTSIHTNPMAASATIPEGFIHEGSSKLTTEATHSRRKRKASRTAISTDVRMTRSRSKEPSPASVGARSDQELESALATNDMEWAAERALSPRPPPLTSPTYIGLDFDAMSAFERRLVGTQMGRSILRFPWETTSLGPINSWSQALKTCVSYCLTSPFREALWVGEELLMMYNDGYITTAGQKHPWLLGKAGAVAWAELWDELKPSALRMLAGETITSYDGLLFMDRASGENGGAMLEETYFTWSWIPIFDSDGKFVAAHNPAFESTSRVIAERRLATLRDIVQMTSVARDTSSYCRAVLAGIEKNPYDLPFAILYSCTRPQVARIQPGRQGAPTSKAARNVIKLRLEGVLGVPEGHPAAPHELTLRAEPNAALFESSSAQSQSISQTASSSGHPSGSFSEDENLPWPFIEAISTGKPVFVSKLDKRVEGFLEPRGWNDCCSAAVVLPIASDDASTHAIVIVGLNPRRPWNEVYATFFQLLSRQLATGLATVLSYESAQAKADEMAALDKARNAFFQNCSHELRTPLTLILGPLEDVLTSKEPMTNGIKKQLETVSRNSHRLLRLVNSLLDFSKLEAGRMMATFSSVNLGRVTADLASLFRSSIERAKIKYDVRCDDVVPSQGTYIDPDLWEKAITNLIGNAYKYTMAGSIVVSLSYTHTHAVFEVVDSGCGIADEERDQIFERFHRIDSVGRSIEGTGIGLALTLEIVKVLGGTLDVTSKLGTGSTFSIRLPLGRQHLPDDRVDDHFDLIADQDTAGPRSYHHTMIDEVAQWPSDATSAIDASFENGSDSATNSTVGEAMTSDAPLSLPGSRVLICDDNQDMRRYCRSILSSAHYSIIEMTDGQAALEYAMQDPPDLILSDIMMPRLDGFGLLHAIRAYPRTHMTPIILLSAKAGAEARVEGLQAGADDYLVKPFSAKELLARVANHLAMGKMRRELEKRVEERTIALTESEARQTELANRLKIVTDLSPVGIFSTDGTGQLLYVNPQWYSISGMSPEQPRNNWLAAVHPQDQQAVHLKFSAAISKRQAISIEFRWANDTWTQMGIHPLVSSDEHAEARFVGSLTDTSELKRLEALHISSLEQRAAEAEQMRRLQELSIDVSSHELRNPLSGLHQNAELIASSFKRAKHSIQNLQAHTGNETKALSDLNEIIEGDTESIESILLCSQHMQRIAHDILAFSKANMGLLVLSIGTFSMRELVEGCLRMFGAELRNHDVSAALNYTQSMIDLQAEWIIGDGHRLSQVLINFVSNSIRFLSPRPVRNIELRISASATKPPRSANALRFDSEDEPAHDTELWVTAAVTDTGPGLSHEESQKLFRRFGQANPSKDSLTGFGLGLFVSRKIVELSQGYIEVESVKGEGSTFSFSIPTRRAEPPAVPARRDSGGHLQLPASLARTTSVKISTTNPAPTPVRHTSSSSSRASLQSEKKDKGLILVVDDNMINLRVLVRQLQANGYTTVSARDGLEAVQAYEKHAEEGKWFDAGLLDLEMPVMDGHAAIRRIREIEAQSGRKRLPTIAVTGNARDAQKDACIVSGFDEVAIKPYSIKDLCATIEQLRATAAASST